MNYQVNFTLIIFSLFGSVGGIAIIISKSMNLSLQNAVLLCGLSLFITFCIGLFFIDKIGDKITSNDKITERSSEDIS